MKDAEPVFAFLGLGGNVGDRAAALRQACRHIAALPFSSLSNVSPVYETAPWGFLQQADFLNAVAEVRTSLQPIDLFLAVKNIERALGRRPSERNHPRIIDIDVLLYGDLVLNDPRLIIPHPGIPERRFVLQPLADLAPELEHPVLHISIRDMLARCATEGAVYPYTRQRIE